MAKEWVRNWNERLRDWISIGATHDMGIGEIRRAYMGTGPTAFNLNALPEPYVGDPLGNDLDAVMLMLNPGTALAEQIWPGGTLIDRVKHHTYYQVASSWDYPVETVNWWARRSEWPARLLRHSTLACRTSTQVSDSLKAWQQRSKCEIVGIDLVPWHSTKWGRLNVTDAVLQWAELEVLKPAASIAERTTLSTSAKRLNSPLVLAVGSKHAQVLPQLGFRLHSHLHEDSGITHWPNSSSFRRVRRNIRLFISDKIGLAVLQTDAQGGLTAPQSGFDVIIRDLLGL